MVSKIWGIDMGVHEDTIYSIVQYIEKKRHEFDEQALSDHPIQTPFSRWAIDEIISELKYDMVNYPDEVIKNFMCNMKRYEEVAEPERRMLYQTAYKTAKDLYSYLFESNGKETIPF